MVLKGFEFISIWGKPFFLWSPLLVSHPEIVFRPAQAEKSNRSAGLFLQRCKQQHLDKPKKWIHRGCLMAHRIVATRLLHITQSHKGFDLWVMLDLWPVKYPCAKVSPGLFLRKCWQQYLDKLGEVGSAMGCFLAHRMVAAQWLHVYSANSQKVTFCDFCLTFDPWGSLRQHGPSFVFSEVQAAVLRCAKWSGSAMGACWRIK